MILKELNNYRGFTLADTTGNDEYNILMAYLLTVDEVNISQERLLTEAMINKNDSFYEYRILWTPNIAQYEFNEQIDIGYEYIRLLAFLKYSLDQLKSYFIEYLRKFKFKSVSELFTSIHQVSMATLNYHQENIFKKLNFIKPSEDSNSLHLDAQKINSKIGLQNISLGDLRKYPLFHHQKNGFMVIDEDLYNKRSYKGIFFEMFYNTSLNQEKSFNSYSSEISFEVLEKKCFHSILSELIQSKHDFVHFDDLSTNAPDCYFRRNRNIQLFEFKGYIFPDDLSANPNFENIKKYIDKRFIESDNSKSKGIGQIINQLNVLRKNEYQFDFDYKHKFHNKRITIYPIIVHTEFHFSIPGINEYLNDIFLAKLSEDLRNHFDIKPITLINLKILYDFVLRNGTFQQLENLLDQYFHIVKNRRIAFNKNPSIDTAMRSKSSFDEIYNSLFLKELKTSVTKKPSEKFRNLRDITQDEFDEILAD